MHLLKNKSSKKWMKRCSAFFILNDYSNFEKLGLIKEFEKVYKCKEIKEEEIEEFVNTKTNVTDNHFILDEKLPNLKQILSSQQKACFMPIPLTSCNENPISNSLELGQTFAWPVFVGWFWNNYRQKQLHKIGKDCFKEILSIDNFRDQLKSFIPNDKLEEYWKEQKGRLHVTAMYIGSQKTEEKKKYLSTIYNSFYTTVKVNVTGILLTRGTFSGHVELPTNVMNTFDPEKQSRFNLLPHVTLGIAPGHCPVNSGPDQESVQKMIQEKKIPLQVFERKIGQLQDWGDCRFYVNLKKFKTFELMFLPKF